MNARLRIAIVLLYGGVPFLAVGSGEGRLPLSTVQAFRGHWPTKQGAPESIVYGNETFGYFRSERFAYQAGKISFDFVAPGFGKPLRIFACPRKRIGGACSLLKSFQPKVAAFYEPGFSYRITTSGHPSWRYLLLTGRLPFRDCAESEPCAERCAGPAIKLEKGKVTAAFAYIVNAQGQVVWAHALPPRKAPNPWSPTVAKALTGGRIGILTGPGLARYTVVDHYGNEVRSEDLKHILGTPLVHHDFIVDGDQRMGVLTSRQEAYRKPWRWQTFWQLPSFKKFIFEKQSVQWIDLEKGSVVAAREISATDNPFEDTDWVNPLGVYVSVIGRTPTEPAINYSHPNSLQRLANGYLISLHAQSRVAFLSDAGSGTSWTLGGSSGNDYIIKDPNAAFHRQHHVTQLPSGEILLFDNLGDAVRGSRLLKFALDRQSGKPSLKMAYYPAPPVFTDRHGSAVVLTNGNLVGFFAPKLEASCVEGSVAVEFDGVTGAEVSRTTLAGPGVAAMGYRALPLDAVGPSEYLGARFSP